MKKLFFLIVLLVALAGCSNNNNLLSLKEIKAFVSEKGYTADNFEENVIGKSSEEIIALWGEPDFSLSGLYGDGWYLDEDKTIILYYDGNDNVMNIYINETTEEEKGQVTVGGDTEESLISIPESAIHIAYVNYDNSNKLYSSALNAKQMAISSAQHLPIFKIDSQDELEKYKEDFAEAISFDQGYDEVPSFNEATSQQDETFFDKNSFILVYIPASSGSYRYGVDRVEELENKFYVHIARVNEPEIGTDDMAGWMAIIEIEDSIISEYDEFDADLVFRG